MSRSWEWYAYDDEVLAAIDAFWLRNYVPPTLRDICELTSCPTTSTASNVVKRLARNGVLLLRVGRPVPHWVARSITISDVCGNARSAASPLDSPIGEGDQTSDTGGENEDA